MLTSNASGKDHQAHLMHPAFMASGRQFEAMPVTFCSNVNIQSVSNAVTINGVTHATRMYFVKAILNKTSYGNLTFPQRKD